MIEVDAPSDERALNYLFNIPRNSLSVNSKGFRSGYYISSSNNGAVLITISTTTALLSYVSKLGTDVTSNSTITVYYR